MKTAEIGALGEKCRRLKLAILQRLAWCYSPKFIALGCPSLVLARAGPCSSRVRAVVPESSASSTLWDAERKSHLNGSKRPHKGNRRMIASLPCHRPILVRSIISGTTKTFWTVGISPTYLVLFRVPSSHFPELTWLGNKKYMHVWLRTWVCPYS